MSKNSSSDGIGVLGLLGVAFVILKLTNYIDWSWWYVTLPFWGGIALLFIILGIYLLYKLFTALKSRDPKMGNPQNPLIRKSKFQQRLDDAIEKSEIDKKWDGLGQVGDKLDKW